MRNSGEKWRLVAYWAASLKVWFVRFAVWIDWLVSGWVGLAGQLLACLGWLVGWWLGWLVVWVDWLVGWLVGWFVLIVWLVFLVACAGSLACLGWKDSSLPPPLFVTIDQR